VGDGALEGWLSPLNKAIYPSKSMFRNSTVAPACPNFGEATVLLRPLEYEGPGESSVRPGLHAPEYGNHDVVWWDPAVLNLDVEPRLGLHYEDILAQDEHGRADESIRQYAEWKASRASRLDKGSVASLAVFIATEASEPPDGYADRVEIIEVPRTGARPSGPRFGSLVHLILRDAPLTASKEFLSQLARTHGRLLAATDDEILCATVAVFDALQHPLLARVRQSDRIHRELPVTIPTETDAVFEGVIDLAFFEAGKWVIADFKTDVDQGDRQSRYRRQVGWYMRAMEQITGASSIGVVMHI